VKATVLIRPKPGILDPQGQAVGTSLRDLEFAVGEVRVGRVVDLDLETDDADEARALIDRMCERMLANPLIESFTVELEPAESTAA
jgi:phosphoribosylformylglycinamidine synthase